MPLVIYEKKGRTAYITLNRPEALNAMNHEAMSEFGKARLDFKNDPDVWICILSGAGGKAFSVGADVKELADKWSEGEISSHEEREVPETEWETNKPMIAAIDGWCIGGGLEWAMGCDLKVATAKSRFGVPEPKVGRNIGGGATYMLPAQIPYAIAMEMLLTGDPIDARRAYEAGLINQVVESSEELMPAAEKMAERVLACAPLSIRLNKEQVKRQFNQPIPVQVSMCNIGEEINLSQDAQEGVRAFAEKRKPDWQAK